MRLLATLVCVIFTIIISTRAQLPPRLNIPGAVLLSPSRPAPFRQQRIQSENLPQHRPRRPIPIAAPIRPVIEETEETATPDSSNFDDEVNKLGISALQNAVRQAAAPEQEEVSRPVHFRPERPIPVLRQDVRDGPPQRHQQAQRQEQRENIPRPLLRQEARDDLPVPVRQPQRQAQPRPIQQAPQQPIRQPTRGSQPRPQYNDNDDERPRNRKPPVQILRKYRTDNADGSITWGFENEDGTFKEENLGIDCVTRGKYGYIDPDGVRREYSYETGNKCDPTEEEEEEQLLQARQQIQPQPRKPAFRP